MEIRDVTPQYLRNQPLPFKPIYIMPIGDIQMGSDGCDIPKLKDYIAEGLRHDAWFHGMGDFTDAMSPSNRRKFRDAGFYDTTSDWIERKALEDVDKLEEILAPTKGRWTGLHEGHHFFEFSDGTTTDTQLCQRLEAPFLGTCGLTSLHFKDDQKHAVTCVIWSHHGSTAGQTVGSIINKLEKIAIGFPNADILMMGHGNRLTASPLARMELRGHGNNLYLTAPERRLVATGSFDKGYTVGSTYGLTKRPRGGYVEQAAMTPTTMGAALIRVEPRITDSRAVVNGRSIRTNYSELDIKVTI